MFNLVDVKRVIERVLSQGGMCGLEEDGRWEPGGRPGGRGHGAVREKRVQRTERTRHEDGGREGSGRASSNPGCFPEECGP